MNIYKEPGKRNGRARSPRADRYLELRVLDAPTSGDAALCYVGTHEFCAYTKAKGSPDLRLDRELQHQEVPSAAPPTAIEPWGIQELLKKGHKELLACF